MNQWSQYPMLNAQPVQLTLPFTPRFFSFEKASGGTKGQFFIFKGRGESDTTPCYETTRPQGIDGTLDLINLRNSELITTIIPYSNGWGVANSSHTMATHRLIGTRSPNRINFSNYYRFNRYTVEIEHVDTTSTYKIDNAVGSHYGTLNIIKKGDNITRRLDIEHVAEAAGKEAELVILCLIMVLSLAID
ncbi:hypothetical protein BKA70DRAFT_1231220 [Coprinopsis sp. MPI-PUGE-AT-0042]|nr:hypothetical protein BKA70DRAFT_1231220 [Coprinopsis sp. MPI-PUGE-AT-0042]